MIGLSVWRAAPPSAAPPSSGTTAQLRQAILRYELADAFAWPKGAYGRVRLSGAELAAMTSQYETAIRASTCGDLLASDLSVEPWRSIQENRRRYPRMLSTGAGGRLAYYDFVRRTTKGDLVVHAIVQQYNDSASWDFARQRLKRLGRKWWRADMVSEYVYTQTDDGWRIVSKDAVPLLYDMETGKLTHGWP
jgi:hypothetical protein